MIRWQCTKCGRTTTYRPSNFCVNCDNTKICPVMEYKGYLGFQEEGHDVGLFQCPVCKNVTMNRCNATTLCRGEHP